MSNLIFDKLASTLIPQEASTNYTKTQLGSEAVSEAISDTAQTLTNGVVLSLSATWLAVSAFKPARTLDRKGKEINDVLATKFTSFAETEAETPDTHRYDRQYLYSLRLGDYFMPLSQTFNLRAKKRLNICSLVDGIDIIQQTRKEAKTIDCSLRITLRKNQPNLEIISNSARITEQTTGSSPNEEISTEGLRALETFGKFLVELYENDAVFAIDNKVINDTFGVKYATMSEYSFLPQVGKSTFNFNFTLTEVKITDDTLTQDLTQIKN